LAKSDSEYLLFSYSWVGICIAHPLETKRWKKSMDLVFAVSRTGCLYDIRDYNTHQLGYPDRPFFSMAGTDFYPHLRVNPGNPDLATLI
jgi:hypothetical protein